MTTTRPSRLLQSIHAVREQERHLAHHRTHLTAERFEAQNLDWNHPPVVVTLGGPWKNRESAKVLAAWGIPSTHQTLDGFVHHRDGGWGVFQLPRMSVVYAFLGKVVKHPEAVAYMELLCRIALHSQYTLSEAVSLIVDMIDADPQKEDVPALRAQEWEYVGRYVIDVLQARTHRPEQAAVGDMRRVAAGVKEISAELDMMRLDAAERRLASVRATLALRRAS